MIILAGPGGRHCVLGSLAWSTVSYLCFPKGVRIISCPGKVFRERSPLPPPNQTPVRSGCCAAGWAIPRYHQAPTFGEGLRGVAPRCGAPPRWGAAPPRCAGAGPAVKIKKPNVTAAVTIEFVKRLLILNLQNRGPFAWVDAGESVL